MRRLLFLSIFLFLAGCSDVAHTPSGTVKKFFDSQHSGDMANIKGACTPDYYRRWIGSHLGTVADAGKVFAYDREHFKTEPESLRRLEKRLETYLKTLPKKEVVFLREGAPEPKVRLLTMEVNGKTRYATLRETEGFWKIERISDEP